VLWHSLDVPKTGLFSKLVRLLTNLNIRAFIVPLLLLTTSSAAQSTVGGDATIGSFEGRLNDEPLELTSIYNEDQAYSDLTISEASGIITYKISSSIGEKMSIFWVTLQEGNVVGDLDITSVTLIDKDYDTALAADHIEVNGIVFDSVGVIDDTAATVGDNGSIMFALSADLIRVDLETREVLDDQDTARIEGQYSGVFPRFEIDD